MNRSTSWLAVLPSLIIPTCIGLIMYLGLSVMLEKGVIENDTFIRYVTGHPVSKATLILFFIGLGSILMISLNVISQFHSSDDTGLKRAANESVDQPDSESATQVEDSTNRWVDNQMKDVNLAIELGQELLNEPKSRREHYLWRRLHEALHFVHRTGSSYGLEEETKYLAELDQDRQQQRYSLVRIMIWATPMLGFLGTVLGISQALGGISVGPDNDFSQMMSGLRSSLYVAFDTTALALVLSMLLMFGQFIVDRFETQLLKLVDLRTRQELAAHFDMSLGGHEAIERMGVSVLETTDHLVRRQSDLWQKSMKAAEKAWKDSLTGVNKKVQENLKGALDESMSLFATRIDQSIEKADHSMSHRWQQWQITLSENSRNLKEQHKEIASQNRLIQDVVNAMVVNRNEEVDAIATSVKLAEDRPPEAATDSSPIVFTSFSPDDAREENEVIQRSPVPEIILQPASETPILQIFDPADGQFANEREASSIHGDVDDAERDQRPRYVEAERHAGVEPVVNFPVEVQSKNAA